MGHWILVVESDCNDPSRQEELEEWYRNVHYPDVLETSGIVKATRYELTQEPTGNKTKYLNVYDIETDDLESLLKKHQDNMNKKVQQGRISSLLERKLRGIYKEVFCLKGKK